MATRPGPSTNTSRAGASLDCRLTPVTCSRCVSSQRTISVHTGPCGIARPAAAGRYTSTVRASTPRARAITGLPVTTRGLPCDHTGFAKIGLAWTGPSTLRVTMESPSLDWTLTASSTTLLDLANAVSASLPMTTWKPRYLVRARELMGAALGMGHIELSGVMPSGHTGKFMPERMYFIERSRAVLGGVNLGRPTRLPDNPFIGGAPLPVRGVLVVGQAAWKIRDHAEYERTRSEMRAA